MVTTEQIVCGEKKNLYMDGTLYEQLTKKVVPSVQKKDFDWFIAIDGEEGCQPANSKVMMANGDLKNIEDIKIGDVVLSPQENGDYIFSKVLKTYQWYSDKNYRVTQLNRNKKTLYKCSYNHLIPFKTKISPRKQGRRDRKDSYWTDRNYQAEYVSKLSIKTFKKNSVSYSMPLIPYYHNRKNCEIESYSLGVFLGDGSFCGTRLNITSNDRIIIDEVAKHYKIMSIYHKEKNSTFSYRFSKIGEFGNLLNKYGLFEKRSGTKFIPEEALFSDSTYRKRLLAGLIDTDGYYHNGSYEFTLKSLQLIKDIRQLSYSLGGRCGEIRKVKKRIKRIGFEGTYYSISLYLCDLNLPILLKRKTKSINSFYLASNRLSIDVIEDKPSIVYGFQLDSPSSLYITDNYMVTHNSGKSVLGFQIAKVLDPGFSNKQVAFTANEFMKLVIKAKKHQCIIFDESFTGLSSRSSLSEINQLMVSLMMEMRQKNLFVILIMPTFFMLDKYCILHRAKGLFHVYMRKGKRGFWNFYNRKRMKLLYLKGKKFYDYNPVKYIICGRFYEQYMVDEDEYRSMKTKSLNSKRRRTRAEAYKLQRDLLLYGLYSDFLRKNKSRVARFADKWGIGLKRVAINDLILEREKNLIENNESED